MGILMKTSTIIRNFMILTKNCETSSAFFVDVLGMKINHISTEYAELVDKNNVKLVFKQTESEAHTKIGYSPIITFNVESYDMAMEKLEAYDVEFDGEPIDNEMGKLACIRTPEGLMIGIYESKDDFLDTDDFNVDINADANLGSVSKEIKGMLDKFKF